MTSRKRLIEKTTFDDDLNSIRKYFVEIDEEFLSVDAVSPFGFATIVNNEDKIVAIPLDSQSTTLINKALYDIVPVSKYVETDNITSVSSVYPRELSLIALNNGTEYQKFEFSTENYSKFLEFAKLKTTQNLDRSLSDMIIPEISQQIISTKDELNVAELNLATIHCSNLSSDSQQISIVDFSSKKQIDVHSSSEVLLEIKQSFEATIEKTSNLSQETKDMMGNSQTRISFYEDSAYLEFKSRNKDAKLEQKVIGLDNMSASEFLTMSKTFKAYGEVVTKVNEESFETQQMSFDKVRSGVVEIVKDGGFKANQEINNIISYELKTNKTSISINIVTGDNSQLREYSQTLNQNSAYMMLKDVYPNESFLPKDALPLLETKLSNSLSDIYDKNALKDESLISCNLGAPKFSLGNDIPHLSELDIGSNCVTAIIKRQDMEPEKVIFEPSKVSLKNEELYLTINLDGKSVDALVESFSNKFKSELGIYNFIDENETKKDIAFQKLESFKLESFVSDERFILHDVKFYEQTDPRTKYVAPVVSSTKDGVTTSIALSSDAIVNIDNGYIINREPSGAVLVYYLADHQQNISRNVDGLNGITLDKSSVTLVDTINNNVLYNDTLYHVKPSDLRNFPAPISGELSSFGKDATIPQNLFEKQTPTKVVENWYAEIRNNTTYLIGTVGGERLEKDITNLLIPNDYPNTPATAEVKMKEGTVKIMCLGKMNDEFSITEANHIAQITRINNTITKQEYNVGPLVNATNDCYITLKTSSGEDKLCKKIGEYLYDENGLVKLNANSSKIATAEEKKANPNLEMLRYSNCRELIEVAFIPTTKDAVEIDKMMKAHVPVIVDLSNNKIELNPASGNFEKLEISPVVLKEKEYATAIDLVKKNEKDEGVSIE